MLPHSPITHNLCYRQGAPGDQIYGGTSSVSKHSGGTRSSSCSCGTAARWVPCYAATMRYRSSAVCLLQPSSHAHALDACDCVGPGEDILTLWLPPPTGAAGPITTSGPADARANTELLSLVLASGCHSNASNSGRANGESTWVVASGQVSFARGGKWGIWQGHTCTHSLTHHAALGWRDCRGS